jgi:hypothetical protein
VFLELKSSDSPSGYTGQFKSTQCFVTYLLKLAKTFHPDFSLEHIEERFVLFHLPKRLSKQPSRLKDRASKNPENPQKIPITNNGRIFLMQLLH